MTEVRAFDVAVVGAGPAGLAAALAFAHLGLNTVLIGPMAYPQDGRTAALFRGSIDFLKRIGVWTALGPLSEPIGAIRLIDSTGGLVRAPEVTFWAHEVGEVVFGYNIKNSDFTAAAEKTGHPNLTRHTCGVSAITITSEQVRLTCHDLTTFTCRLVAGADGRNSLCRPAAGIATRNWTYPQSALVCVFSHTRPHDGVSTEFHRRAGPLTVVPMPGNTSSLVWVDTASEAERLKGLSEACFTAELSEHLHGLLGTLSDVSERRVFALSGLTATEMGANRTGLIGEAGHIIPPIGAQGLNLSFRDGATLAELAAAALKRGGDPGGADVLSSYTKRRLIDVTSRIWTVDALNRSLLSSLLPVQVARSAGIMALNAVGPLRRLVMKEGIAPSFAVPDLMQPYVDTEHARA